MTVPPCPACGNTQVQVTQRTIRIAPTLPNSVLFRLFGIVILWGLFMGVTTMVYDPQLTTLLAPGLALTGGILVGGFLILRFIRLGKLTPVALYHCRRCQKRWIETVSSDTGNS